VRAQAGRVAAGIATAGGEAQKSLGGLGATGARANFYWRGIALGVRFNGCA